VDPELLADAGPAPGVEAQPVEVQAVRDDGDLLGRDTPALEAVPDEARYSARTELVILRRSRCVSPIECSVVTITGVRARRAAGRA
jgi:hypothetical protein